ncbi:hypothetical protein HT031_003667 [Scenedesmus sp. PABB004]|nr:hypothetical protein HT031_003667 [Scenedesmus sp. PABB004]
MAATAFHFAPPLGGAAAAAAAASPPAVGAGGGSRLGGGGAAAAPPAAAPPPAAPSAAAELARLTEEYEGEAALVGEQLELVGVTRDSLTARGRLAVALLAGIASALGLSTASPALVLAAWAALAVRESKLAALQHQLEQEAGVLAAKRLAAQAKLKALQGVLHDVQAQQRRWGATVAEGAKTAAAMRQKHQEYTRQCGKHTKRLAANGFAPEARCARRRGGKRGARAHARAAVAAVGGAADAPRPRAPPPRQVTHGALVARAARVEELGARLAELRGELAGFHCLPDSVLGARMMLDQESERLAEKQARLTSRLADMH